MGDRRYNNAIRETRLYLCRGAHHGAQTRLGSASAEPSLPQGLDGGLLPKSHAPFFKSFFEKIPTPNSLARSDESVVKNPRTESLFQGQKAGRVARRPTPLGYGTPSPPFAQGAA